MTILVSSSWKKINQGLKMWNTEDACFKSGKGLLSKIQSKQKKTNPIPKLDLLIVGGGG